MFIVGTSTYVLVALREVKPSKLNTISIIYLPESEITLKDKGKMDY